MVLSYICFSYDIFLFFYRKVISSYMVISYLIPSVRFNFNVQISFPFIKFLNLQQLSMPKFKSCPDKPQSPLKSQEEEEKGWSPNPHKSVIRCFHVSDPGLCFRSWPQMMDPRDPGHQPLLHQRSLLLEPQEKKRWAPPPPSCDKSVMPTMLQMWWGVHINIQFSGASSIPDSPR